MKFINKFILISILPILSSCQKEIACFGTRDIDGNVYNGIQIGNQCWMQSNLKVTKYKNGDIIPTGLSAIAWDNTTDGAYAIFNDDLENNEVYGKLYNHYAVTDKRGLCPSGWRVPSDAEWMELENYLGGWTIAGGTMKTTTAYPNLGGWNSPNEAATNSSGFSAMPAGIRLYNELYVSISSGAYWWSVNNLSGPNAVTRTIISNLSTINRGGMPRFYGLSVRCLRD